MPSSCAVPECRGNYKNGGPKVKVYRFPKDEMRQRQWIIAMRRANFVPTKHSRVCERHFVESDFIREASAVDPKTGIRITCKLDIVRLKQDAVPSVFPEYPNFHSKKDLREDPEKRRIRLENEQFQLALKQSLENQEEIAYSAINNEVSTTSQFEKKFREEIKESNRLSTSKKLCCIPVIAVPAKVEREAIFGNYIASEMRVISENPVLYLQTKQAILEVLTSANFKLINPETS